ncbi:putative NADH-dependent flavin oxidoreductase YqiG [Prolixibacter bellariivorans]|uniref:Putative NADH-dependent flavin oxidoreductase YqiG n=1 Tax=Prolixibacter bellariivorans TaxID=314319 RepID=A0A5M4B1B5_9BACT|nr:NADH-dependent flavin oxidoreductase [Prolixibacter bellariivorans]GET33945.1 putative NADH-dependent flavin oxidoreductase YqiG [Prolixibacter bellariivorans]
MKTKFASLFNPLHFKNGLKSRNRITLAPMTHYSSFEDGSMNPEELPYIKRRSKETGIVITACYAVTPEGKAYVGEPLICNDSYIPDLKKLAKTIKDEGALAILQLHHGGGVCPPELVDGNVVSPSGIATPDRSVVTPRELTSNEIEEIIIAFGEGTRRAIEAGFDGVEMHGAYGYLLQQFISPYTNRRTDEWGGSQKKRFALPLRVIEQAKNVIRKHATQPFLLGYRFSPEESLQPGLTMRDALDFTEALVKSNVDFIDVLVNSYDSKPRAGLDDLSEKRLTLISKQINNRTVLLGGGSIYTAEDGLNAYLTGVDAITIAREMVIEPEWITKVKSGKEDTITTELKEGTCAELDIPVPFWNVIWSAPGWFSGTEKIEYKKNNH